MTIKAIETRYKGYLFRSRLEARWAVYLDAIGLTWEYEKEGFDLNGTYYLPDFWLPSAGKWLEIKPTFESANEQAILLAAFSSSVHENFFVAVGGFDSSSMYLLCKAIPKSAYCQSQVVDVPAVFGRCPLCGKRGIWWPTSCSQDEFMAHCWTCDSDNGDHSHPVCEHAHFYKGDVNARDLRCWMFKETAFRQYVQAARSARFEHGHSGRTL